MQHTGSVNTYALFIAALIVQARCILGCVKPSDGSYLWNETVAYGFNGYYQCTSDCRCTGSRVCGDDWWCQNPPGMVEEPSVRGMLAPCGSWGYTENAWTMGVCAGVPSCPAYRATGSSGINVTYRLIRQLPDGRRSPGVAAGGPSLTCQSPSSRGRLPQLYVNVYELLSGDTLILQQQNASCVSNPTAWVDVAAATTTNVYGDVWFDPVPEAPCGGNTVMPPLPPQPLPQPPSPSPSLPPPSDPAVSGMIGFCGSVGTFDFRAWNASCRTHRKGVCWDVYGYGGMDVTYRLIRQGPDGARSSGAAALSLRCTSQQYSQQGIYVELESPVRLSGMGTDALVLQQLNASCPGYDWVDVMALGMGYATTYSSYYYFNPPPRVTCAGAIIPRYPSPPPPPPMSPPPPAYSYGGSYGGGYGSSSYSSGGGDSVGGGGISGIVVALVAACTVLTTGYCCYRARVVAERIYGGAALEWDLCQCGWRPVDRNVRPRPPGEWQQQQQQQPLQYPGGGGGSDAYRYHPGTAPWYGPPASLAAPSSAAVAGPYSYLSPTGPQPPSQQQQQQQQQQHHQPYMPYPPQPIGAPAAAAPPAPPPLPVAPPVAQAPPPAPPSAFTLHRQLTVTESVARQMQLLLEEAEQLRLLDGGGGVGPAEQQQQQEGGNGEATVALAMASAPVAAAAAAEPEAYSAAALSAATGAFADSHLLVRLPQSQQTPAQAAQAAAGAEGNVGAGASGAGEVYRGRLEGAGAAGVVGAAAAGGGRDVAVWRLAAAAAAAAGDDDGAAGLGQAVAAAARRLVGVRHPHLLPLLGSCSEQPMVVYDLGGRAGGSPPPGGDATATTAPTTLATRLLPPPPPPAPAVAAPGPAGTDASTPAAPPLGWKERVRVGAEVAAVVAYLHAQSPPVFCQAPLDAGRVLLDSGSGAARLGFVGVGDSAAGGEPVGAGAGAAEDTRALGVLLLRLLTGDVAGDASALVSRVRAAQQADVSGGAGGRALAALVFDAATAAATAATPAGGAGDRWPAAEALAFANVALRCCGSFGAAAADATETAAAAESVVPSLRSAVLPYLLQLSNRTRLYDQHPSSTQQPAGAPASAAAAAAAAAGGAVAAEGVAVVVQLAGPEYECDLEDVPPLFMCPITQDLIEDPVVAADGFTYERAAIEQWIACSAAQRRPPRSPLTNLPLAHAAVVPNRVMKSQIAAWKEEQAKLRKEQGQG